jgi:hypothetical protein
LFLLDDLKTKLKGEEFDRVEELEERVEELLGQIIPELRQRLYEHWVHKMNQLTGTNGNYIENRLSRYQIRLGAVII